MGLVSLRDIIAPMWYVYILLCKDKSLYTGISTDPIRRFEKHTQGKGGAYTRSHKPLKILYQKAYSTKSHALKREAQIKNWTRSQKIRFLNHTI